MSIEPIVIDAIVYANTLTLLTIGFTLTYLISEVPNFAHGTFAGIGIYVTFTAVRIWGINPYVTVPLAFILSAFTALFVYVGVLRTLMKYGASRVSLMITTIAIELIIVSSIWIYTEYIMTTYGKFGIYAHLFLFSAWDFMYKGIPGILIVSTMLMVVLVISLHVMLTKTKFGIALRSTVENSSLASTLGVNVEFVRAMSWFLTGGLAGLAGSLLPLWFIGEPGTGSKLLLSVFAASVLGGMSSIYGAIMGGCLIGIIEILGNKFLVSILGVWVIPYRSVLPLSIMCLLLLRAPYGIVGIIEGLREGRIGVLKVLMRWLR